jgi:hypothetical protein
VFLVYAVAVWMFSPNLDRVLALALGPALQTWLKRGFSGRS